MIILIHGTGDDDTKDENWIKWVGALMQSKGEKVLVLPGVSSGQQGELYDRAHAFLTGLKEGDELPRRRLAAVDTVPEGLRESLRSAAASDANELRAVIAASKSSMNTFRHYEVVMQATKAAQRHESGRDAIGIKTRAAFAALCGKAYWQTCPPDLLRPIRIIGHSRGGSAAIATHNVLRHFGITYVGTLTLDPCHGVKKLFAKDYTHTVWSGVVNNIPVVKEVGIGTTWFEYTLRPPISIGEGADADTVVNNHGHLATIEHGHMGKLTTFKKPGKLDSIRGRADAILATKAAAQAALRNRIAGRMEEGGMELTDLFALAEDKHGDLADKQYIHRFVCALLAPIPVAVAGPAAAVA
ncbi:MAG: hypothetical protein RL653_984 [Pseudomonadota bacterium]|jgi:hypothetical protein